MKIGLQSWGSEGDVRPFLALAHGLKAAGHEVKLVITEVSDRNYENLTRALGLTVDWVATPVLTSPEAEAAVGKAMLEAANPMVQARAIIDGAFEPALEAIFAASQELAASCEVLLGHYFLHPLMAAAEKAGRPYITIQLADAFVPTRYRAAPGMLDLGRFLNPLGWWLAEWATGRIMNERVNNLRRRLDLPPCTDIMGRVWASPLLNLVAVSPALTPRPPDWPDSSKLCGFFALPTQQQPLDPKLEAFLAAGPPPIYFCFGSLLPPQDLPYQRAMLQLWKQAASELSLRAILQAPSAAQLQDLASESILVLPGAPHDQIFPRCAAIIHHGGAGTTQSTLRAGRPALIVPHIGDQFFWAKSVQRAGSSPPPLPKNKLQLEPLRMALQSLLQNPQYAERASAIGAAMSKEDGVARAVSLINEIAEA